MEVDQITEIGIDDQEQLYVAPKCARFPFIYREAMEVHWNEEKKILHSPKPRQWSYADWLRQILSAAEKQAIQLKATPETSWRNVSSSLKKELEQCL